MTANASIPWLRLLLAIFIGANAVAQAPAGGADDVEAYLSAVTEVEAASRMAELLALPAADLEKRVTGAPPSFEGNLEFAVVLGGKAYTARVEVPGGHGPSSPPLPVAFNLKMGRIPDSVPTPGAIRVTVPGYDPPRFSDEARDGILKVVRSAARRANGDPDALWVVGFSWAAHQAFDLALHRPGVLRGIVALGGGPRRKHFRLAENLRGRSVLAGCGAGDDRELLWNLKELERVATKTRFDYELIVDENTPGRLVPAMKALKRVGPFVAAATSTALQDKGKLLADGPAVESAWLRIDEVDPDLVSVPDRIPVPGRKSPDAARRYIIRSMAGNVASLRWEWKTTAGGKILRLDARGVRRATIFLRRSRLAPGSTLRVVGAAGRPETITPEFDPATLLREARRRGDRIDPPWAAIEVSF